MEDEESGMALNFQSTRGQKRSSSKLPVEDTMVKQPRRHQITARIGCAVMFLLIGALIAHRIWAFQMRQPMNDAKKPNVSQEPTADETEHKSDLFGSPLWQFLCRPLHTGLAENTTCKLCPENWFLYEDKCYWISKEKGSWGKGKEDCTAKSSRLLVMQKQKDVVNAFIQQINGEMQLLWIGLQATYPEGKWTWVDGSPIDDKQSQELGPVEANSCGMLNGNEIISEACSSVTTWVCETEALTINNDKV